MSQVEHEKSFTSSAQECHKLSMKKVLQAWARDVTSFPVLYMSLQLVFSLTYFCGHLHILRTDSYYSQ